MLIKSIFFLTTVYLSAQIQNKELVIVNGTKLCKVITKYPTIVNAFRNGNPQHQCDSGNEFELVCCPKSETGSIPDAAVESTVNTTERISQMKCAEYSSLVFTNISVLGSPNKTVVLNSCGQRPKIYANAVINEGKTSKVYHPENFGVRGRGFPHAAAIGCDTGKEEIEWVCTGALLSDFYVLSAAHCFYHQTYGEPKYIRLGALDLLGIEPSPSRPETYDIEKMIAHPSYNSSFLYDDIGLIKLNRKVNFNIFIRPACLPMTFDGPEKKLISLGYRHFNAFGILVQIGLETVNLDKSTFEECSAGHGIKDNLPRGILNETQICAGHQILTPFTSCENETVGGVLQVFHQTHYCMYNIIGVSTFGNWCSTAESPAIYTRVYSYLDWIEGIIWG